MSSSETKAANDRKQNLRIALSANDLTLEGFVALCWESGNVPKIDVHRVIHGVESKQVGKELLPGFPPDEVVAYLMAIGEGRYILCPIWNIDQRYVTRRPFTLGDASDAQVRVAAGASSTNGADVGAVVRDATAGLKDALALEGVSDLIDRRDGRRTDREMRPMEVMGKMFTDLLAVKGAPQNVDNPIVTQLRDEIKELKNEIRERLRPAEPTGLPQISSQIAQLGEAAKLLGWAPRDGKAPPVSTLETITAMANALSPQIDKLVGLGAAWFQHQQQVMGHAQLGPGPAPSAPTNPADTGGPRMPPQLSAEDREQLENLIKALEDRDWDTAVIIMQTECNTPVIPRVNVNYYLSRLKRLDQRLGNYGPQLTELLKWAGEQKDKE